MTTVKEDTKALERQMNIISTVIGIGIVSAVCLAIYLVVHQ